MPYTPNQNWLKLLQKELPAGKTVEDMQFNPLENISYHPYISEADFTGNIQRNAGWKICADVRMSSPTWKDAALHSLQCGAEALYVPVYDGFDAEKELKDIFLDYIFPIFDLSLASHNTLASLTQYLQTHYANKLASFAIKKRNSQEFVNSHFNIFEILEEQSTNHDMIEAMAELCRSYSSFPSNNTLLSVHSGKLFFIELARLRAYRILLANLDKIEGRNRNHLILVNSITEGNIETQVGNVLISQTYTCLSAVLGGADLISLLPWKNEEQNWSRISQNIQHLMKHESHLDHFSDPLAGSYFLEDLTEQIVREVWKRI